MKTLCKILKALALFIGGSIIGWFGFIICHLVAWHNDRDQLTDFWDRSDEYWEECGIWRS